MIADEAARAVQDAQPDREAARAEHERAAMTTYQERITELFSVYRARCAQAWDECWDGVGTAGQALVRELNEVHGDAGPAPDTCGAPATIDGHSYICGLEPGHPGMHETGDGAAWGGTTKDEPPATPRQQDTVADWPVFRDDHEPATTAEQDAAAYGLPIPDHDPDRDRSYLACCGAVLSDAETADTAPGSKWECPRHGWTTVLAPDGYPGPLPAPTAPDAAATP